jgi:hypothetical protein
MGLADQHSNSKEKVIEGKGNRRKRQSKEKTIEGKDNRSIGFRTFHLKVAVRVKSLYDFSFLLRLKCESVFITHDMECQVMIYHWFFYSMKIGYK